MCGRFAQKLPSHMLLDMYRIIPFESNTAPNYNVAPTDPAIVVRANPKTKQREAELMKWGLIPSWSKTGKMEAPTFNARCETAASAAVFRNAFKSRRCIVPADAFYEWKKLDAKTRQPYAIGRADGRPLSLAGLWEGWKDAEGKWLHSFTILTTSPNSLLAEVHNRMPVILDEKDHAVWLGEAEGDATALMAPCPAEWLRIWKVSARVGSVKNNDADLLEPVE
ncbi:MAG TPA: SOS response-associated peptidase [Reyranella sp.]|nr:SOS response-associated peptidase [Reyranella sp.]